MVIDISTGMCRKLTKVRVPSLKQVRFLSGYFFGSGPKRTGFEVYGLVQYLKGY